MMHAQKVFEKYSKEVKDFSNDDFTKCDDNSLQYEDTEVQFDWQLFQHARKQALEEVVAICYAADFNENKYDIAPRIKELLK